MVPKVVAELGVRQGRNRIVPIGLQHKVKDVFCLFEHQQAQVNLLSPAEQLPDHVASRLNRVQEPQLEPIAH